MVDKKFNICLVNNVTNLYVFFFQVSGRLVNAAISEVEYVVRDILFNKISESSINELVDFFTFQRRLYLSNLDV